MLDSIYRMSLKLLWNGIFLREKAKILPFIRDIIIAVFI